MRSLTCAALALVIACGANDDAPSTAPERGAATPVAPAPEPVEATAELELAAVAGLRSSSAPGQGLHKLDRVTPFGATAPAPGCIDYNKAVATWFASFQREYEVLETNFSPDDRGAAAMRKFAAFLRAGAASMQALTVDADQLAKAHEQFVAALQDLAAGFDALASGLEHNDRQQTDAAAHRVENAVANFRTALDDLKGICGD